MNSKHPHTIVEAVAWDPIHVRDLVRNSRDLGINPASLVLGQAEAAALRNFLAEAYGAEAPTSLRATYYLGLKVREDEVSSRLTVTGSKRTSSLAGQLAPLWADGPGPGSLAA